MNTDWRTLEANIGNRKESRSSNFTQKQIVPLLSNITDDNHNQIFTIDDIHLAAGVLDTNCFELKTSKQVRE